MSNLKFQALKLGDTFLTSGVSMLTVLVLLQVKTYIPVYHTNVTSNGKRS